MPEERTIIASFPSSSKARTTADALAAAGLADVHIRRNSRYGVSQDPYINDPISHQAESLASLVLFSTNSPNDENQATKVLMDADPSVSGMSARGYGMAGGAAFTLVAFVPEPRVDEAVGIIKANGGDV
ncbi:hypothetical protein [Anaeroselena agilis]|uniref:Uncharacterized protein n=1 Tax=Anaeroselena agilis TaxID=3063788 RepID=A0ABU3P317_9FIRM|nr:hypothetical protein [Selenomonadales bacterium 4137-cl]